MNRELTPKDIIYLILGPRSQKRGTQVTVHNVIKSPRTQLSRQRDAAASRYLVCFRARQEIIWKDNTSMAAARAY